MGMAITFADFHGASLEALVQFLYTGEVGKNKDALMKSYSNNHHTRRMCTTTPLLCRTGDQARQDQRVCQPVQPAGGEPRRDQVPQPVVEEGVGGKLQAPLRCGRNCVVAGACIDIVIETKDVIDSDGKFGKRRHVSTSFRSAPAAAVVPQQQALFLCIL